MSVLSKCSLQEIINPYTCHEVVHPWSESCVKGTLEMVISTLKGGIRFFAVMYGAQILFKIWSKKKIDYKKEAKYFLRSLLFILTYSTLYTGGNCMFRKIFGKFQVSIIFILVPILTGFPIFLESHRRLVLNVTTFLTGAMEGFYRSLQSHGKIRSSRLNETLGFMLLNGFLMYILRAQHEKNKKNDNPWFFVPMKIKDSPNERLQRECSHEGPCTRSLQKDLMKFGGVALLISSVKLILMNYKYPSRIANGFFKWNNWKIVTFIGLYIGIFKIVSCYLCKTRGDSLQNTFIAGLLGGLSYGISPNVTFLFSVLTALLKVKGKQLKEKYNLPRLPYLEITFMAANAYQLYLRGFDRKNCPRYLYNMLNVVTCNRSEETTEMINQMITNGTLKKARIF